MFQISSIAVEKKVCSVQLHTSFIPQRTFIIRIALKFLSFLLAGTYAIVNSYLERKFSGEQTLVCMKYMLFC